MAAEPSIDDGDRDDNMHQLREEVARLRELVGPNEQSYHDLQIDLLAARDVAKGAQAAAGSLRGRVAALEVELVRAQQDQEEFQRVVSDRFRGASRRVRRSIRSRLG